MLSEENKLHFQGKIWTGLHWHVTLHSGVFALAVVNNVMKNDPKLVKFDHDFR